MSIENGGPAFPQEVRYITPNQQTGSYGPCGGMTLRDYFAAKAMQGLCSNHEWLKTIKTQLGETLGPAASAAYEVADAMLAARNEHR